jgi:hypothetical protein
MSQHPRGPSPPPRTYTPRAPVRGPVLTCRRCARVHPFPRNGSAVRCECGWRYSNEGGQIHEEFKPRLAG